MSKKETPQTETVENHDHVQPNPLLAHGNENERAKRESLSMSEGAHWGFGGYFNNSLAGDL